MRVISRREEMTGLGHSVGFVPTMGALHEGHVSLIRRARAENKKVVVSLFVNPLQFGPKEDYSRYPRVFSADRKLCASLGVDVLYHPGVAEIYPPGFATEVEVKTLSSVLCGQFRPGHFKGVATVVLKLLETVRPGKAYFGEKDFQQLVILKRMVEDLNIPVSIVPCPTVRESDGLAMSSRNRYLKPAERAAAPLLYAALRWAAQEARRRPGRKAAELIREVRRQILTIPKVSIDYVEIVNPENLQKASHLKSSLRLLAAIHLGRTRLIDNIAL